MPTMTPDKRSAWLQKLDAECPYQITLPRRQLTDDAAIMDFLLSSHLGKFDMYVEDECAAYMSNLPAYDSRKFMIALSSVSCRRGSVI